ncbi:MAG: hypothetical protein JKX75_04520 [Gammaproteobacteria bacterium]|nr:hypothetical protein [Gammaproteobacteria bacterium]
MKNFESVSSRRKFMTMGASTAAVLLGGAVLSNTTQAGNINESMLANGTKITHNSVKNMVADKSLKSGDTIATLGYHQVGDDGDNIYIIVNSSPLAVDGGSLIKLNNGLQAQALFPSGVIRVEQFGAIGLEGSVQDNTLDNTKAMTSAHNTGKLITYGAKHYPFTTLSIAAGGIIGQGSTTILSSTDSSTKDVISYLAEQQSAAYFKDFTLTLNQSSPKSIGAGISLTDNANNSTLTNDIENVTINNMPTAIKLKSGTTKIVNNNIHGGSVGIELSLSNSQPLVYITGNRFEQQLKNAICIISQSELNENNQADFSQVLISQNQINANKTTGAAINIAPTHFSLEDLSVNNNLIRFQGKEQALAAISISNATHFMINNNTINCQKGAGHRGIYISESCNSGILSANHVILPLNGHTLNLSATTTVV